MIKNPYGSDKTIIAIFVPVEFAKNGVVKTWGEHF